MEEQKKEIVLKNELLVKAKETIQQLQKSKEKVPEQELINLKSEKESIEKSKQLLENKLKESNNIINELQPEIRELKLKFQKKKTAWKLEKEKLKKMIKELTKQRDELTKKYNHYGSEIKALGMIIQKLNESISQQQEKIPMNTFFEFIKNFEEKMNCFNKTIHDKISKTMKQIDKLNLELSHNKENRNPSNVNYFLFINNDISYLN